MNLVPPPFEDEVLGRVTWSTRDACWQFTVGPINGWAVPASYVPADGRLPPDQHDRDERHDDVAMLVGDRCPSSK